MGHWLMIASSPAGSTDDEDIEAARRTLAASGEVELTRCSEPGDLARAFDQRGDRNVALAGGDGSLHLAVAEAARRGELAGVTFALLPMGTGNDFARSVGIPLDPAASARVAATGRPRSLDLIEDADGGVVVNAVHVGVGADAAEAAQRHKGLMGAFAFRVGAVLAGVRTTGCRLRVTVDGRVMADGDSRVLMVAVGNGSSVGGGTPLLPAADPGDGRLDVLVSRATGPVARVGYGWAQRKGTHVQRPDVDVATGQEVTVSGEPVRAVADGELSDPLPRRTWRVRPGAWRLMLPAG